MDSEFIDGGKLVRIVHYHKVQQVDLLGEPFYVRAVETELIRERVFPFQGDGAKLLNINTFRLWRRYEKSSFLVAVTINTGVKTHG